MKRSNLTVVLAKFARSLSFYIDIQKIYDELLIHPDSPSLLAVSDVLRNFNIDNESYQVDMADIQLVPCPFIAHTNVNGGDFLLVHSISAENVVISNEDWHKHKMGFEEFKTRFSGFLLTAEKSRERRPSLQEYLQFLKKPLTIVALIVTLLFLTVISTGLMWNFDWRILALTIEKSLGLLIAVLLLVHSFDKENPIVQRLCQSGDKVDCDNILSSKAAKTVNGLSWSEIGFFYFSATWLLLIFGKGEPPAMGILAVANLLTLPFTIYSVYYQGLVARKWCVLCCTVLALLWLEFISLLPVLGLSWTNTGAIIPYLGYLLISAVIPIAAWLLIKPLLNAMQEIHPLKAQIHQLKFNTALFEKMLQERPVRQEPSEEWSIVLGNPSPAHTITVVSNPYCPPCAKMHKELHDLIEQRTDLQARIVFTATNNDNDIKTPVCRHLMALNSLGNESLMKKALLDWYESEEKSYETWAKSYPVPLDNNKFPEIDEQKNWCDRSAVIATPTILLNGYHLPSYYQLKDFKYMLQ